MKHLLAALLPAAALSLGAISPAHATATLAPIVMTFGSGLTQTGSFSDLLSAAGGFTDTFLMNPSPPVADTVFTLTAGAGVTFSSFVLEYFNGASIPLTETFSPTAITATGSLNTAVYELVVKGTATAGASYTGTVATNVGTLVATPPVPEPASWAMMLAGLGVCGALARRRKAADPA